jgi:hypothetical protein
MVTNCGEKNYLLKKQKLNMYVLKGLRFQLIEGRAMAQSDIKITFEDLKAFTTKKHQNTWHNDKQILLTKFKEL